MMVLTHQYMRLWGYKKIRTRDTLSQVRPEGCLPYSPSPHHRSLPLWYHLGWGSICWQRCPYPWKIKWFGGCPVQKQASSMFIPTGRHQGNTCPKCPPTPCFWVMRGHGHRRQCFRDTLYKVCLLIKQYAYEYHDYTQKDAFWPDPLL